MRITKRMVEKGYVEINKYDMESWKAANEYNESTKVGLGIIQRIAGLQRTFKILNIFMLVLVNILEIRNFITVSWQTVVQVVVLVMFIICMAKKQYRIYTFLSFALLLLGAPYIAVGIFNLVMFFLINQQENKVQGMLGYPDFNEIRIVTVEPKKEVDKMDYNEYPRIM